MKCFVALTWLEPSRYRRISLVILFSALAVVVVAQVASYCRLAGSLVTFPYQVMEAEGLVLWMGITLLSGWSPYQDPDLAPWVVAVYAPLFPLLSGLVALVSGASAGAGRSVSVAATAGCLCLIAWLIRAEDARWSPDLGGRAISLVPAAVAGSYLVSPFVFEWSALGRVDMLMVMLSLLAVAAAQQAERRAGKWIALAGLFCVLALWTKQTALAAPGAITLWLALRFGFRRAVGFACVVAAFSGLGYVLLDAWSGGGFVKAAVAANALSWSPRVLADYWRRTVLLYGWFLAGAALYVWWAAKKRRPGLLVLYIGVSGVLTASAGHTGAAMNYFLEFLAAAAICAGLAWQGLLGEQRRQVAPLVATAGLLLQVSWFPLADLSPLAQLFGRTWEWGYAPTAEDARRVADIERLAADRGGPLLAEDPVLNLRLQLQAFAVPASSLRALSEHGRWETGQRMLIEAIEARQFSTIVLTRQDYPYAVFAAIEQHYRVVEEAPSVISGYRVYVPKG